MNPVGMMFDIVSYCAHVTGSGVTSGVAATEKAMAAFNQFRENTIGRCGQTNADLKDFAIHGLVMTTVTMALEMFWLYHTNTPSQKPADKDFSKHKSTTSDNTRAMSNKNTTSNNLKRPKPTRPDAHNTQKDIGKQSLEQTGSS